MGEVQGDAGEIRRLRRAAISHISPMYLPYISLHLPYISPASPLHLPYISPTSPLHLACAVSCRNAAASSAGAAWEIWGRYRGDIDEMYARYRRDAGEIWAASGGAAWSVAWAGGAEG